jgi:hypothetical protein
MARFIHIVLRLPSQLAKLLIFAKAVLAAMSNNPSFSNAAALLATLADRIQALEKVLKGSAAERRAAREAVCEALEHLRDHVQVVAETAPPGGTVDLSAVQALVQGAQMDLRKVGAHPKLVFAAKHGPIPGSVDLTAPRSTQRDPHEWAVSTDQQTWTALPSTRQAKTRVTGLPIGMPHYFRHRLLTKDGYTQWSDPTVMIIVK